MKVLIPPGASGNVLAAVAIGAPILAAWKEFALPHWTTYCKRHDLGLIVFDTDLIPQDHPHWKKPTWQKMIIGQTLRRESLRVRNVCFLDVDILINPTAPSVFDGYDENTIGLVSQHHNMPFPRLDVRRRLAFLRNRYYDKQYPLDSALFISLDRLYEVHGLEPQPDEACSGFLLFNVANHADVMGECFHKYDRNLISLTGGGEQTHVNHHLQSWGKITWLDYKWQALWAFEMAWKYPFLYDEERENAKLVRECIEASMFTNYFLHFAGSWHESKMWRKVQVLESEEKRGMFHAFHEYLSQPVTGEPVGPVKPAAGATA